MQMDVIQTQLRLKRKRSESNLSTSEQDENRNVLGKVEICITTEQYELQ